MTKAEERWRRLQRDWKELNKAVKRIPGVREDLKGLFGNENPVYTSKSRTDINSIVIAARLQMEVESLFDLLEEAKGIFKKVMEARQDWKVLAKFEDKMMFTNGTMETCSIPRAFANLIVQSESFDGEVSEDGDLLIFKHHGKTAAKVPKSLVLHLRTKGREVLDA